MRRAFFAVASLVALSACSTETAGLGGDLLDAELEGGEIDTSVVEDDTKPIFTDDTGGDDATELDATPDASLEDVALDGGDDLGVDGALEDASDATPDVPDVPDVSPDADADAATPDAGDVGIDAAADVTPDAASDASDSAPDVAPDVATDAAPDVATDSGTGLVTTPGKISCSEGGGAKQCNTSDYCCGRIQWDLSWSWKCDDGCFAARDFKCDEKADCSGGNLCCAKTPLIGKNIEGSDCRSSCGDDPQLCMTNAECTGGKSCVAQKTPDAPHTIGVCK